MSTSYQQEIYKFLTQKDNYKASKQLVNQIPQVEDQLKREFWEQIRNELDNKVDSNNWKLKLNYPEWLFISYKDSDNLGINCQQLTGRPYYGIYAPENEFLKEKIVDIFTNSTIDYDSPKWKSSDYHPYYQMMEFDFSQQVFIEGILPDIRKPVIDKVTHIIYEFYTKLNDNNIIQTIANKAIKPQST